MRHGSLVIATVILAACQTGGGSGPEPFANSADRGTIAGGPPARIDGILDCTDEEIVFSEQPSLDPDEPGSQDPVDAMGLALSRWLGPADEPTVFGSRGTAVSDGREVARVSVAEAPAGGWTVELLEYCRS